MTAQPVTIQKLGHWRTEWEDSHTVPAGRDAENWLRYERAEEWARFGHYGAEYRVKPAEGIAA